MNYFNMFWIFFCTITLSRIFPRSSKKAPGKTLSSLSTRPKCAKPFIIWKMCERRIQKYFQWDRYVTIRGRTDETLLTAAPNLVLFHLKPSELCLIFAVFSIAGRKHPDHGSCHAAHLFRIDSCSVRNTEFF